MLRLVAGGILIFIALLLELWLNTAGIYVDLVFATLIAFALVFEFWELALFVALSVFILNWQPAPSVEIAIFALFPIVVYFAKSISPWQPWVTGPIMIIIGFSIFYSVALPHDLLAHLGRLSEDIVAGIIMSELVFFPLTHFRT